MKKYLVNDLPNQTLTGSLRIDGGLTVTDGTHSIATYRALLTDPGVFTGTSINAFNGGLIVGETYTITNYVTLDDFSNVAQYPLISGTMNFTGCQFVATGEIPLKWTEGSALESSGNLVVDVLENNLGYDIEWSYVGTGWYAGYRSYGGYYNTGLFNDWPRSTTSAIISQSSIILFGPPPGPITQFAGPGTAAAKDDCIAIFNFDYDGFTSIDNWMYYTPIEIKVKQDLDTTPIAISGTISPDFPFANVAFDFMDDGSILTETIYSTDLTTVNSMEELVDLLNQTDNTSYFGTYAADGAGITLTMPMNLKRKFSPSGTLSIVVFQD